MRKIIIPLFAFIFFTSYVKAQISLKGRTENSSEEKFTDRLFFGGNFGLQFGSQTYVELAPIIGYKVTERFSTGLGIKYIYYKVKDLYTPPYTYSTNIYGGGPFVRYILYEGLFLHAEYEALNLEVADAPYYNLVRKTISSVFLGGGYRQMIGDRSSIDFIVLFNINQSRDSPYKNNPIIRIGFGFGI